MLLTGMFALFLSAYNAKRQEERLQQRLRRLKHGNPPLRGRLIMG